LKARTVDGGFGGLRLPSISSGAQGYPADITIYEADGWMRGGFSVSGSAESGYSVVPSLTQNSAAHSSCLEQSPRQAIYLLLGRTPRCRPVYQGQYDTKALLAALKVFVCQ
jgi:hypothetical protein